jgi:hypothetical protein
MKRTELGRHSPQSPPPAGGGARARAMAILIARNDLSPVFWRGVSRVWSESERAGDGCGKKRAGRGVMPGPARVLGVVVCPAACLEYVADERAWRFVLEAPLLQSRCNV